MKPAAGGAGFEILFEGEPIPARPGDTVAAALWNAGRVTLRTSVGGERRGLLCAMGSCWECQLQIDGRPQRSCITPCAPGMDVRRAPAPGHDG